MWPARDRFGACVCKMLIVATSAEWRRLPLTRRRSEQSVISPGARCISSTSATLGSDTRGDLSEGARDAESKQPVRCALQRSQRTTVRVTRMVSFATMEKEREHRLSPIASMSTDEQQRPQKRDRGEFKSSWAMTSPVQLGHSAL